ncbi:unnamed protein product, partial [Urochloa humidicola]
GPISVSPTARRSVTRSQDASSRAHGSRLACVSLVSRRSQPRCRVVASPPPLPPSRRSACHFPLLHPTAHHSPLPRAPRRDKRRLEREGCSAGAPHGPPHARAGRRETGRGRRGEERRGGMALGVVFHGAQLALDLVVAGMSLAVALGFFAVVTTVLCSAAFLHHSKPAAAS